MHINKIAPELSLKICPCPTKGHVPNTCSPGCPVMNVVVVALDCLLGRQDGGWYHMFLMKYFVHFVLEYQEENNH